MYTYCRDLNTIMSKFTWMAKELAEEDTADVIPIRDKHSITLFTEGNRLFYWINSPTLSVTYADLVLMIVKGPTANHFVMFDYSRFYRDRLEFGF